MRYNDTEQERQEKESYMQLLRESVSLAEDEMEVYPLDMQRKIKEWDGQGPLPTTGDDPEISKIVSKILKANNDEGGMEDGDTEGVEAADGEAEVAGEEEDCPECEAKLEAICQELGISPLDLLEEEGDSDDEDEELNSMGSVENDDEDDEDEEAAEDDDDEEDGEEVEESALLKKYRQLLKEDDDAAEEADEDEDEKKVEAEDEDDADEDGEEVEESFFSDKEAPVLRQFLKELNMSDDMLD